jgi:hypothetical protein
VPDPLPPALRIFLFGFSFGGTLLVN